MSTIIRRGYKKHPNADLDYGFRLHKWLAGDGVHTVQWTVPSGLVGHDEYISGGKVGIWLSGGTDGACYTVTAEVVTDSTPLRRQSFSFDLLVDSDVSV